MQIDFFKLLPIIALLLFVIPKKAKGYYALFIVAIGVVAALLGVASGWFGLGLKYVPMFSNISSVFVLAISGVAIGSVTFAAGYLKGSKKSGLELSVHFLALVTLVFSMLCVLKANTKFDFLIYWELMTLCSFVLIIFNGVNKDVLHGAVGYLILMHIGYFCIMYGIIGEDGSGIFIERMPFHIWVLMILGFGLKAGFFPLHIWMPVAYPIAPSHVSALMSGGMINMGVYGIVRATYSVVQLEAAGYILFVIGVVSALFGIVKASTNGNLKKIFAYSSIENIGIICLALGIGSVAKVNGNMPLAAMGICGAMLHMINHANFKAALFLSSGSIKKAVGSDDLSQLGGLYSRMPITGLMFLIAILGICAIVPFGGFFSEFIIFSGMFEAVAGGHMTIVSLIGIVVLAFVGGFAVITFVKSFGASMLGRPRSCAAEQAKEINGMMMMGFVLPIAGVLIGGILFPILILPKAVELFNLNIDAEALLNRLYWIEGVGLGVLILGGALYGAKIWLQKGRAVTTAPTWGCGFSNVSPQVQYGAHSSSAEIETALIGQKETKIIGQNEIYPQNAEFNKRIVDKANVAITHFSTNVLRKLTAKLALFQTGKVNHYILHALLFILLIIGLSIISFL